MLESQHSSKWFATISLLIAIAAGVAAFLPFSADTSAWDAVTLRVPGDQGNWWHFIAGAPFFLAFIMIWLSARSLFSSRPPVTERRILWSLAAISVCGTLLIEMPVLFRMGNLAEMGLHHQLTLLVPSLASLALCATVLILRRKTIPPVSALMLGLCAAYLTNAAFCLGMYAPYAPQSGWHITMVLVWLIALQVVWIVLDSYGSQLSGMRERATGPNKTPE